MVWNCKPQGAMLCHTTFVGIRMHGPTVKKSLPFRPCTQAKDVLFILLMNHMVAGGGLETWMEFVILKKNKSWEKAASLADTAHSFLDGNRSPLPEAGSQQTSRLVDPYDDTSMTTKPPPVAKTLDEANHYARSRRESHRRSRMGARRAASPGHAARVHGLVPLDQLDATRDENPARSCLHTHRAAS